MIDDAEADETTQLQLLTVTFSFTDGPASKSVPEMFRTVLVGPVFKKEIIFQFVQKNSVPSE